MYCFNCSKPLEPIHDHLRRRGDFPQYKDALVIEFIGGYGMYVDDDLNHKIILCGDCASKEPLVNKFIKRT